ncbi:MAG: DUF3618 domain-containing protein [Janthinobacterium lividum]
MTTSSDPEEIRREIERTRANLSGDVDALADQANPKNIARRQVENVKGSIKDKGNDLKDKIMGVASDANDSAHETADNVRAAAGDAQGVVSNVPGSIKRRSQGNPLGAGLVAFGLGLLVSSLIPASQRERQAAVDLKERAEPLTAKITDAAKEVAGNLKEPAQQAAADLKDTATSAAQHVKEQGQDAAQEVKGTTQDAQQNVKDESASAAGEVRDQAQQSRQSL